MFYVFDFNTQAEDFEPVGAFAKRDEAEAFAAGATSMTKDFRPLVVEMAWREVLEQAIQARLGKLAEILKPALDAAFKSSAEPPTAPIPTAYCLLPTASP